MRAATIEVATEHAGDPSMSVGFVDTRVRLKDASFVDAASSTTSGSEFGPTTEPLNCKLPWMRCTVPAEVLLVKLFAAMQQDVSATLFSMML